MVSCLSVGIGCCSANNARHNLPGPISFCFLAQEIIAWGTSKYLDCSGEGWFVLIWRMQRTCYGAAIDELSWQISVAVQINVLLQNNNNNNKTRVCPRTAQDTRHKTQDTRHKTQDTYRAFCPSQPLVQKEGGSKKFHSPPRAGPGHCIRPPPCIQHHGGSCRVRARCASWGGPTANVLLWNAKWRRHPSKLWNWKFGWHGRLAKLMPAGKDLRFRRHCAQCAWTVQAPPWRPASGPSFVLCGAAAVQIPGAACHSEVSPALWWR